MTEQFIAIDFETANESRGSICQVGLACFIDGQVAWTWESLVNPEEPFCQIIVGIHGIKPKDVQFAPKFPEVLAQIEPSLTGQFVVSHTDFDFEALHLACAKYNTAVPECAWIDTRDAARRAWPNEDSYGLEHLADRLGIEYKPHVAVDDARACGLLLLLATAECDCAIDSWPSRKRSLEQRTYLSGNPKLEFDLQLEGNPEGPLAGHEVVFTGKLSTSRYELANLAAQLGCKIHNDIRKSTTVLVCGEEPGVTKLKSAERSIFKEQPLSITTEQNFWAWIDAYRKMK